MDEAIVILREEICIDLLYQRNHVQIPEFRLYVFP